MGQSWTDCLPCPYHGGYSCPENCTGDSPEEASAPYELPTPEEAAKRDAQASKVAPGCLVVILLLVVALAVCLICICI